MKANELRIGNLVKPIRGDFESNGMWSHEKEDFYTNNNCVEVTAKGLVDIESGDIEVEPISLTKEWLFRFRFEKPRRLTVADEYHIGINPVTLAWLFDIVWIDGQKYPFYKNGFHQIKYVHHLQNIYYDLAGDELALF